MPVWFALADGQPLAFFAGIWAGWTSVRKLAAGGVTCDLFAFPTATPNAEVGAIHPKAMPGILTRPNEVHTWLTAPWEVAQELQRPLPDGALVVLPEPRAEPAQGELLEGRHPIAEAGQRN